LEQVTVVAVQAGVIPPRVASPWNAGAELPFA